MIQAATRSVQSDLQLSERQSVRRSVELRENLFNQLAWWKGHGEDARSPRSVAELLTIIDQSGVFIGNCSGPGHLAAICGVPTFTVYGPSLHEWFVPLHPAAEIFEGKACPYKPCADYCRLATPACLWNVTAEEVWPRVKTVVEKHLVPRTQVDQ